MAKKPLQHHIDENAKLVLQEVLNPVSWNVEMHPDYGIDFRIQMLDGDEISWQVFLVQLKGHERFVAATKNGQIYVKQTISVDRVKDYFEIYRGKCRSRNLVIAVPILHL